MKRFSKRTWVVIAIVLAVAMSAIGAFAYFTAAGSGSGDAEVGAANPPSSSRVTRTRRISIRAASTRASLFTRRIPATASSSSTTSPELSRTAAVASERGSPSTRSIWTRTSRRRARPADYEHGRFAYERQRTIRTRARTRRLTINLDEQLARPSGGAACGPPLRSRAFRIDSEETCVQGRRQAATAKAGRLAPRLALRPGGARRTRSRAGARSERAPRTRHQPDRSSDRPDPRESATFMFTDERSADFRCTLDEREPTACGVGLFGSASYAGPLARRPAHVQCASRRSDRDE